MTWVCISLSFVLLQMFGFHKPKMYRSIDGCCICRAKSSSSRFTDSKRYETNFKSCFGWVSSTFHRSRWGNSFSDTCSCVQALVKPSLESWDVSQPWSRLTCCWFKHVAKSRCHCYLWCALAWEAGISVAVGDAVENGHLLHLFPILVDTKYTTHVRLKIK